MIVLFHESGKICAGEYAGWPIARAFLTACRRNPDSAIGWWHESLRPYFDASAVEKLLHQHKLLFSYNTSSRNYLEDAIGFVEENTPFIKVNKNVTYPTWQMSADCGLVHASAINALEGFLKPDADFDYFLNSLAKRAMQDGLLCYSEPKLLSDRAQSTQNGKAGIAQTFRFVSQHYRKRWVFLLLFNLMVYNRLLPVFAFLAALLFRGRAVPFGALSVVGMSSFRKVAGDAPTIDVVIPTIGRREHLYNVLRDLAAQTVLPVSVIIIEQNPDPASVSELDYLKSESWPFEIKHTFIHRTGVCNARNLGLGQVTSEFVFLADDDIRFDADLLEKLLDLMRKTGTYAMLPACLQRGESVKGDVPTSFSFFAGHCLMKTECLDGATFPDVYEFGYGEDQDFGMQLRNKGYDVLLAPQIRMLHLKAPMGGFRTRPELRWQHDTPQPKPSPTVMLFVLSHRTREQLCGYKTVHFFKAYGKAFVRRPWQTLKDFRSKWGKSVYWAERLAAENR